MTIQTKTALKTFFETGDHPTQAQFGDLIDTFQTVNGVSVFDYGAKGDGITIDTTAIQDAIDQSASGASVFFPSGYTFRCTKTLTVRNKKILTGGGKLSFTSGITSAEAIGVYAPGCKILNLHLDNPNELQKQTGGRNFGILVSASEFTAAYNTIEHFQNGIGINSRGEHQNIIIAHNRIKDNIGAGDGPSSGSSFGEDRGDGIVIWGAQATIVGNILNAKAGQDCRIGIHAEGLASNAPVSAAHSNSMVTITGNVVYGQYRRGIADENVSNCTITGNTIADSTWWALAFSGANSEYSIGANNTILWTRTSSDNQGSAWNPRRTPIIIYSGPTGPIRNVKVTDNVIKIQGFAVSHIVSQATSANAYPENCTIEGNHSVVVTGSAEFGIFADVKSVNLEVRNNYIEGFGSRGLFASTGISPRCIGNKFNGVNRGALRGISLESGGSAAAIVCNNVIQECDGLAISISNKRNSQVCNNVITSCNSGIDLFGCDATIALGNTFIDVSAARFTATNSTNLVVNNTGQVLNTTFSWDPGNLIDGTGETKVVTVSGATLGDYVQISAPYSLQGITCTGYVAATDTVEARLQNETTTTINLASGTWLARVQKSNSNL